MLNRLVLEPLIFEWSAFAPHAALRCLPAVAIALGVGLGSGHAAAGMIAASGAVSVGFGSFQRIGESELAPMLFATIGMSVSTLVGTLAGISPVALAIMAALWGFIYGLLMALGAGASWVGLQSVIALLVVSAYPVSVGHASARASLILAGGILQIVCILLLQFIEQLNHPGLTLLPREFSPGGFIPAIRTLKDNLAPDTKPFGYALRLAAALAPTAGLARWMSIEHGYWVPMTVLLVLKPDFNQTFVRGIARVLGTLLGAAVATLIAALVRPGPDLLALLVLIFAALCFTLLRVNYAVFTACVTAYIVFLLAMAGLPALATVKYRTLNTILGGVIALIIYVLWPVRRGQRRIQALRA